MKPTVRKRIVQYTVILGILASTAWFGWYFAHKKAAEILEPYVLDLIAEGDYEGLELLVKWRPGVISRVTFPQKYAFIHTNPTWLRNAPRPIDISLLVAQDYPLIYAAVVKKPQAVRILLENGADPNMRDSGNETALFHATRNGDLETIRLLSSHGANPNVIGRNRLPPVFFAKRDDVALLLADAGSDLKFVSKDGATVLHAAAMEDLPQLLKRALAAGVDSEAREFETESTPLHVAAECNSVKCVKALLQSGANKDAENWRSETPLLSAAWDCSVDAARLLLEAGANPKATNIEGCNAFHRLVAWYSVEVAEDEQVVLMIQLLYKAGVDPNKKDNDGRTPLILAGGQRIEGLLIKCIPSLRPSEKTKNE